jgi:hypothetical protein
MFDQKHTIVTVDDAPLRAERQPAGKAPITLHNLCDSPLHRLDPYLTHSASVHAQLARNMQGGANIGGAAKALAPTRRFRYEAGR